MTTEKADRKAYKRRFHAVLYVFLIVLVSYKAVKMVLRHLDRQEEQACLAPFPENHRSRSNFVFEQTGGDMRLTAGAWAAGMAGRSLNVLSVGISKEEMAAGKRRYVNIVPNGWQENFTPQGWEEFSAYSEQEGFPVNASVPRWRQDATETPKKVDVLSFGREGDICQWSVGMHLKSAVNKSIVTETSRRHDLIITIQRQIPLIGSAEDDFLIAGWKKWL